MPLKTSPLLSLSTSLMLALSLSACASGPSRNGPPSPGANGPSGQAGGQSRAPEFEGTLAEPIGLLFVSMDIDKDGATSRKELASSLPAQWESLQGRGNIGAIIFSDWSLANLGSTEAQPSFLAFDTNFNGSLSESEFENRIQLEFNRLDADSDDALTRAELITVISRPQARQQSGGAQPSGGQRGGGGPNSEGGRGGGGNGGGGGGGR